VNNPEKDYQYRLLRDEEITDICRKAIDEWKPDGMRVLVLIPDHTRSCPMGLMFRTIYSLMASRVKKLDFLIALGTHAPLSQEQIYQRVEITAEEHSSKYSKTRFFNHSWNDQSQLTQVGNLSKNEILEMTDGRFGIEIPVKCNRMINDYDLLLICGPVFPHEVVGFSGGNKYIFPGISGPEILNFFHWLGAIITIHDIIGRKWTPVRRVVDKAASALPVKRAAFCMVVKDGGLAGLFAGTPESAWSDAADLSAKIHIRYCNHAYRTVLSCAPPMYDELWVGAKCMYKLESVVEDGGKLIIYAPHIHEISVIHGPLIREIGYHTRDYFTKQWDRFKHYPWGILAHSTHVKGLGTFENKIEKPRIEVILATGIPEKICREINLGFMDPKTITPEEYANREANGILLVRKAGEELYLLKK